jgi:hypothetical protein
MDAYDIANSIKQKWAELFTYSQNSGTVDKPKTKTKVVVNTPEGYREVTGVYINNNMIELELDKE